MEPLEFIEKGNKMILSRQNNFSSWVEIGLQGRKLKTGRTSRKELLLDCIWKRVMRATKVTVFSTVKRRVEM